MAFQSLLAAQTKKKKEEKNQASFRKLAIPMMALGAGADIYSTHKALNRPGTYEKNPIYGERPGLGKMILIRGLGTAASTYLLDDVAKKNPKTAKIAAGLLSGLGMYIAHHNSKQGTKK